MIINENDFILRPFRRKNVLKFNNRCLDGEGEIHKVGEHNGENYYLIHDDKSLYDTEGFICDVESDDFNKLKHVFLK